MKTTLGMIRREEKAFDGGDFYVVRHSESDIVYVREKEDSRIISTTPLESASYLLLTLSALEAFGISVVR